ncbi:hypothetical protein UA31_07455 [Photobacterium angustum]|nr:hypothetical protein UB36_07450 [Photobacterium damselae subsp. damselae]KJG46091.1 hypothetical protein UA31_07455 [Photobacterium angustum]KJG53184.1 hypothetical protein UA34_10580 [Photobacterium angustum]
MTEDSVIPPSTIPPFSLHMGSGSDVKKTVNGITVLIRSVVSNADFDVITVVTIFISLSKIQIYFNSLKLDIVKIMQILLRPLFLLLPSKKWKSHLQIITKIGNKRTIVSKKTSMCGVFMNVTLIKV